MPPQQIRKRRSLYDVNYSGLFHDHLPALHGFPEDGISLAKFRVRLRVIQVVIQPPALGPLKRAVDY